MEYIYSKNPSGPDQDYWKRLSPDEKQWLYEFNKRYYYNSKFEPKVLTPEQYEKAGEDAKGREHKRRSDSMTKAMTRTVHGDHGDMRGRMDVDQVCATPIEIETPEGFGKNLVRGLVQKGQPSNRWKNQKIYGKRKKK